MRTYFIETWGCQMNRHDSELLEGHLRGDDMVPAASPETADLLLLNTCSVREKPVQKIVSRIGEIAGLPEPPVIGVCGCVAQQEAERLLARSTAVGFVLGPGQIPRIGEALRGIEQGRRGVFTGFDQDVEQGFDRAFRSASPRAMVTAVEGCNEFCTFCVVPYTRGRELSRRLDDILAEVSDLAERGLREIELLGQTINAYRCPATGAGFADLLDAVAAVPGLSRIRYITSHPRHFDDRLIATLARHPHVSRYLHLPFQAGSDDVLRRMHRRYTRAEYLDLIRRIRAAVPDINLSTDVIVGFPGETEEDFCRSLDVLAEVRFGQVYAFAFSPRPRTPAARYPDQLPEAVKKERLHRLFDLSDQISRELNEALVGRTMEVLIDGDSRKSADDWQGRADDNRVVNFAKCSTERIGDLVQVHITAATAHSLQGAQATRPRRLPLLEAAPPPAGGS